MEHTWKTSGKCYVVTKILENMIFYENLRGKFCTRGRHKGVISRKLRLVRFLLRFNFSL